MSASYSRAAERWGLGSAGCRALRQTVPPWGVPPCPPCGGGAPPLRAAPGCAGRGRGLRAAPVSAPVGPLAAFGGLGTIRGPTHAAPAPAAAVAAPLRGGLQVTKESKGET